MSAFSGTRERPPECPVLALGKGPLPRVPGKTLGEDFFLSFNDVSGVDRQVTYFFVECRPWHSAKRAFAECQGPALGKDPFFAECHFLALGKGPLCRVPGPALGKIFFFWFFYPFFVRPSHII